MIDYYNTLGVSPSATEAEIRAAYRRLAMKFHPDRQHGKSAQEKKQAEEKFKEIERANRILGDALKRAEYDLGNGAPRSGNPWWTGSDEDDSNFEDLFRQQYHKGPRKRRQSKPPPVRGEDIRCKVSIDADTAVRGGEAKLGIRVQYRTHESIAVNSPAALVAGLSRPKLTFRQRNLYCQFELTQLPAADLERLEGKAEKLGDYILAGHLTRDVDAVWTE